MSRTGATARTPATVTTARAGARGLARGPLRESRRAQVYATLLDEGVYRCAERTMYRILAANAEAR